MKKLIIFCVLFISKAAFSQNKYSINFSQPTSIRINNDTILDNEKVYDVEFFNSKNQVVKVLSRQLLENHSSKRGYEIKQSVIYFFYTDTLRTSEIEVNPVNKTFYMTDYIYNERNQLLQRLSYYLKSKISSDSMQKNILTDAFLNYPKSFPKQQSKLFSKEVRKYSYYNIIYKGYYEKYGKIVQPAREYFFKYNKKGQLINSNSIPRSPIGGTARWKYSYQYDINGKVMRQESYENRKHFSTSDYQFSDSTVTRIEKYYDTYANQNQKNYTTQTSIYKLGSDGNYYNETKGKLVVFSDVE